MSRLLSFGLGLAVLGATYFYTFGIPTWVPINFGTSNEEVASAPSAGGGNPRRGGRRRGGGLTVVTLGEVEQASFNDTLRAIGTGEAINSVDVISDVSGQIQAIDLTANAKVKAGDVLLTLDNRTETINLQIVEGSLQQAQAQIDRYEQLSAGDSAIVTAVTVADARTALLQAQLQVDLARNALEERTIRAPIDGVLGLSKLNAGANLADGASIVTIDDIHQLLVEFELPERALGLLSTEKEVLLSTPVFVGKVFKGEIFAYDNRIDSTTRTITVQARIDNNEGLLLPGMSFGVRLINESEPGAVVPTNAITWTRNGSQIWIIEDDVAKSVPVSIVMRQQDRVWIDAKLDAGTIIVIDGTQKLRDGIKVQDANSSQQSDGASQERPQRRQGQRQEGQRQEGQRQGERQRGQQPEQEPNAGLNGNGDNRPVAEKPIADRPERSSQASAAQ